MTDFGSSIIIGVFKNKKRYTQMDGAALIFALKEYAG
jgi:hypothetical protein